MNANPISSPTRLGRLQHQVIQLAAQRCGRFPSAAELDAVVAEVVRQSVDPLAHRIALTARLKALSHRYAAEFKLPPGTRLVGCEIAVAGGRLDLLWRLPGRRLLGDELKSGALMDAFDGDLIRSQLARQLAGTTARYGKDLLGLRLVSLVVPENSLLFQPDGRISSLDSARSLW